MSALTFRQEQLDIDIEIVLQHVDELITILEPSPGEVRHPHWVPDAGDIRAITYGIETVKVRSDVL